MKIYIEDQILEYKNTREEIDKILKKIDEIITDTPKVLSCMVIDGLEIYNDYSEHILNKINVIEKIEIILQTHKELVDDILKSTRDYIDGALERIEEVANDFYKTPTMQSWRDLDDFLGGVTWIINTFFIIDQDASLKEIVDSYEAWNIYASKVSHLKEILPDFEEALVNNDNILIADILSYEISPMLNEMSMGVVRLLNMEELANGLN